MYKVHSHLPMDRQYIEKEKKSHSQSKNGLYFPNFVRFSTFFPNFKKYFSKCEGKGSFLKSQMKSLLQYAVIFPIMEWELGDFAQINKVVCRSIDNLSFFLSLYTARRPREHYRQVYFVTLRVAG